MAMHEHKILIACEFSGAVRDAFRRLGYEAWSCDLEGVEPEGEWPNYHLYGDVREILPAYGPWDLLIAHPPCTYLCNSGVRWLYHSNGLRDQERWRNMSEGADLFKWLLDAPVPMIAIENPIIHRYAKDIIGRGPDQIVQPWMFGHGETKATCLWLKNLPQLNPTNPVEGRAPKIHHMSPGPNRGKERSRTYAGIAEAMAEQWGPLVCELVAAGDRLPVRGSRG